MTSQFTPEQQQALRTIASMDAAIDMRVSELVKLASLVVTRLDHPPLTGDERERELDALKARINRLCLAVGTTGLGVDVGRADVELHHLIHGAFTRAELEDLSIWVTVLESEIETECGAAIAGMTTDELARLSAVERAQHIEAAQEAMLDRLEHDDIPLAVEVEHDYQRAADRQRADDVAAVERFLSGSGHGGAVVSDRERPPGYQFPDMLLDVIACLARRVGHVELTLDELEAEAQRRLAGHPTIDLSVADDRHSIALRYRDLD